VIVRAATGPHNTNASPVIPTSCLIRANVSINVPMASMWTNTGIVIGVIQAATIVMVPHPKIVSLAGLDTISLIILVTRGNVQAPPILPISRKESVKDVNSAAPGVTLLNSASSASLVSTYTGDGAIRGVPAILSRPLLALFT
jgi:hypothetical protein